MLVDVLPTLRCLCATHADKRQTQATKFTGPLALGVLDHSRVTKVDSSIDIVGVYCPGVGKRLNSNFASS